MASDLATALLSGNASPLAADPAMAQVIPQLSLAQTLTQEGMSGAPAYPAQALGRLASALVGMKMMNDATESISGAYGGAAESLKKVFPAGTQLGDMLRSDSPYVRSLALQQASKAALLNSESKTLGPEQTVVAPSTPQRGGGVVAAGSPGQAGATEAAKNPALISRAGGTAAAEAPYKPGGEITVPGGPSGMQTIPATAATRAAIQPYAPVNPSRVAGQPQNLTGPIIPPGGTRTQPVAPPVPQKPQTPPVEPNAPASFGERFGAAYGGKPVETPEYAGRTELEKGLAKDYAENSTKSYEAGQNLMGRLTTMDHNIDALGPRWMGAGANAKGEFGKAWNSMLDSAGVKGFHIDPQKVATWEEFNKESTRAGMELIKSNFGGSREAASIIQMGASAVPSAMQTQLGAKYNLASIKAATQREIDLHTYKTELLKRGKSLVGADTDFNKAHPAEEYAMKGIVSAIPRPAIDHLKTNPDLAPKFDKQFGSGTSEFILGKGNG